MTQQMEPLPSLEMPRSRLLLEESRRAQEAPQCPKILLFTMIRIRAQSSHQPYNRPTNPLVAVVGQAVMDGDAPTTRVEVGGKGYGTQQHPQQAHAWSVQPPKQLASSPSQPNVY